MTAVEATHRMAQELYAKMEANLAVVRGRLGRPLTLADKILLGHLEDPAHASLEPGRSNLSLRPDRVVLQDVLGQTAFLQLAQTRRGRVAVPTSVHCDHLIQARVAAARDLQESLNENEEIYAFLRSAAARHGADFWAPGAGIIHQVVLESYAFPGQLILGTDSHTPNAGGLGACAVGVGGADAVEVMAGLPWELRYPKRIAVYLTGQLNGWTAPKDVILHVAGKLTVSGATHSIIEYIGPGARTLSATGKASITNMGAELGATTSVFPADEAMARYLAATGRSELVPWIERYSGLLAPDPEVEAEPARFYDRVLEVDLSSLEPHVVGPHSPDRARPISQLAKEVAESSGAICDALAAALIGSCTNSSYQDMSRAAAVAEQALSHGLRTSVPFFVTPGSERVRATLARDGQLAKLEALGGRVLANACGPCIGQWRRDVAPAQGANTIVTSYNRNFAGRNDGRPETMNFIASPEIITAMALAGRLSFNPLTDFLKAADGTPFRLSPPGNAPEVPAHPFERAGAFLVSPPEDGSQIRIEIASSSERLQALQPWPAWDGQDFQGMPVLIKTQGKTTTDQISPAGAWLKYRGHLDRFSDNLLSGARNAFSGERGTTRNALTGQSQPVAQAARHYRAEGMKWIVIGDANYGEGSSREHAALSVRLLGGVAIIARSFARIHESNLKKQGVLALTFADPNDYERISEGDRISLLDLSHLAAGKPVECRVVHGDGRVETLLLEHSYSNSQLHWFRAGSALNLVSAA
ncbi:aconitate hydratase [Hyalangium versicolor]|uniref:aconitate hydratase n=1 Tax=Hyalangium versicolor TaxID=2861190 RepID=UPI001CCA0194|nr:aconitate hydratase [Hyalangium versicolor]